MHRLAVEAGLLDGSAEAVDLGQTPGDIIILSAADSELAALARSWDRVPRGLELRLANLMALQHNLSVDLYLEKVVRHAKLVVVRLLGGSGYWRYGLDELEALCRREAIGLAVLPGDSGPDPTLMARSTLDAGVCERLLQFLVAGGVENAAGFLQLCRSILGRDEGPLPPMQRPDAGLFWPGRPCMEVADVTPFWRHDAPVGAILFYRALLDGGFTAPVEGLIENLAERGINALPIYVSSLKSRTSLDVLRSAFAQAPPDVILNATGFAASSGTDDTVNPLQEFDCPVLQVVFAGSSFANWGANAQGLGPRDLAMNVVLPELDGRIMTRAISFKADDRWNTATQCRIVTYEPVPDRIAFVSELAAHWAKLRRTPAAEKRVAIVLANYPNKDGRIGNGVGYDTPASTVEILNFLNRAGYKVDGFPADGNTLIEDLQSGPTNALPVGGMTEARLSRAEYERHFDALPDRVRSEVVSQWGAPEKDPFFRGGCFALPVRLYGNIAVTIQPARGYNIDPKATYHDPALVPPHGYFALYMWLRFVFGSHAIIHNGKHGNLEWLPGKATALSSACYPEAVLGPLPQLYPFIVNDPGEGTQAKRRTSAVIIDHLTPPLTRAETYGSLKTLETLIDEYYLASGLDRRRLAALRTEIFDLIRSARLDVDAGLSGESDSDLRTIDAYLCDLKEAQIRDGLHVLGRSPEGSAESDLLVALTRVPRKRGQGGDQSLIRALAVDFGLTDFDPLSCNFSDAWNGPMPPTLASLSSAAWRTVGDTIERLELYTASLMRSAAPPGPESAKVMREIEDIIRPALRDCGPRELASVFAGLGGRFVSPGPSGAPTRGRLDVLPTGRNFFSLDNRTLPTPTAWRLGLKSAEDLLARHFQDTGVYPKSIGLTAWGTSNMRTGGDDIAQALAFVGVEPKWDTSSWRVIGFETIPHAKLGRPRVDVTLRISGFFRDAFPQQIELLDKAIRMVGDLEEEEDINPIAARMRREADALAAAGMSGAEARHVAGHRIFGSRPGAYGAGLQALIDEGIWDGRSDLANAYVAWGSYAYGARDVGTCDERAFRERLRHIEAVVHNQDNREHDLLDSDDYYQFEGGMTVAVEEARGTRPHVYHNDHSRPERPVIRTLDEEVGRVVRSRVVNPKWIAGVKRHGYKGAFEIAATVDYMFAFAATTGAVKTHHFDLAYEAFIADEDTCAFLASNNPAALSEIAARFEEAVARGLWAPRSNSAYERLRMLKMKELS